MSSALEALPVSDPKALSPMAALLDDESLTAIVTSCLADASEKRDLIQGVCEAGNWADAGQFAHDIKSTAGQIGAERLREIALQLEQVCKSDDAKMALSLIDDLKQATQETLEAYGPEFLPGILASAKEG